MESFSGDAPTAAQVGVLPDRRELALVAMERTRMPMVVSDPRQPDSPIVMANQAFLDLTGYAADEVIGRNCRFLQGPDTSPAAISAIRRGLAADEHFVSVELLNYRKDGSTFWNQLHVSPVHDEEGRTIYYFGSQQDVSERRRAQDLEAIERLLLLEVDHRAMNALAMVESVLSLTNADTVHRYSSAVRGRIEAIARVHRILAGSSWSGTQLGQLVAEEATSGVVTHGPPVALSPRLAQPIAIVFHELISNARQHGALLNGHGSVNVHWETLPGELAVDWREEGAEIGRGEPPQPGLGLSLVRAIVERQLGGSVALDWAPPGLKAHLVVPIEGDDIRC